MRVTNSPASRKRRMRTLKAKGAVAVAQNEASCVVYGMPKSIVDAGLADEVVDIHDMGPTILESLYRP